MNRSYFLMVWAIMVAGIVFVFSASYPEAGRPDAAGLAGNPYKYLVQHSEHVALALIAMLMISYASPRSIRFWSAPAFIVSLGLVAMTFCTPWGVCHNNAERWLDLPGLPEFQPSELLKVAFIAFVATILARKGVRGTDALVSADAAQAKRRGRGQPRRVSRASLGDGGRDERWESGGQAYWQVLAATGVVVVLLLVQPDQGMASIFIGIALCMLFLAGASMAWLTPLALCLLGGGLLAARMAEYRWERVIAFLDPEKHMDGAGYHNVNMLISLARGGFCGMGLGMSPDKWRWLPAPHTDSIFCVVGGELGFIGGAAVLLAIGFLTYKAVRIAAASEDPFAWYLALGVAVTLGFQGLIHIAVATSCVPCTGLTLPFVSAGGTSMLSASLAAGMVLSVSRHCRPDETRR